jgi:ADP-glucose pyrophosphorylase
MDRVLAIVMAGGAGERLQPLTRERCKGAVPFGGKFRLIDFPLSNCVNSGLRRIYVLTQYLSESLNRHIQEGWAISGAGICSGSQGAAFQWELRRAEELSQVIGEED